MNRGRAPRVKSTSLTVGPARPDRGAVNLDAFGPVCPRGTAGPGKPGDRRGVPQSLPDNTAGTATRLDAREPGRRGDLTWNRSDQIRDGPLSLRVRPSSPRRDCGRRTTSTGGKAPTNVHTKSRLTLKTTTDTPVRNQGSGGACPAGRGPSPARCGQSRRKFP
jgi:hypothetical protein